MNRPSYQQTMPQPRKVLHVTGGLNRGGIETWLLQMAQNINRREYKIDVAVDSAETYNYTKDFLAAGCRIFPCEWLQRRSTYFTRFAALCRANGPYDIVHSHIDNRSGITLLAARAAGTPVRIVHRHPPSDLRPKSARLSAYSQIAHFLVRHSATHLLANSETTLKAFLAESKLKPVKAERQIPSQVLYNAVELERYNGPHEKRSLRASFGLPTDVPLVTFVGRFFEHKNHRQVLRIATELNRDGKRAHFVLAGSYGPLLDAIVSESRGRTDVTTLVGLKDVANLLMSSDVFLFPSLHEGFGIAALEGAAAGLPVIATDIEAIREACPPSHREFMFEPDNDAQAIKSLETMLTSEDLRLKLGEDGRAWASRFSVESSLRTLRLFYGQALAEPIPATEETSFQA